MQPKLYLMFGYPGAGKTTVAKVIAEITGGERLSSDEIRIELFNRPEFTQDEHDQLYDAINMRTFELLKAGKTVIYDANLNRYQHRKEKYDICHKLGVKPVLIWVRTPKELSKSRAIHDSRSHLWPEGETADNMFDRIADVIEEPGPNEQYIELNGTDLQSDEIATKLNLS